MRHNIRRALISLSSPFDRRRWKQNQMGHSISISPSEFSTIRLRQTSCLLQSLLPTERIQSQIHFTSGLILPVLLQGYLSWTLAYCNHDWAVKYYTAGDLWFQQENKRTREDKHDRIRDFCFPANRYQRKKDPEAAQSLAVWFGVHLLSLFVLPPSPISCPFYLTIIQADPRTVYLN